VTTATQAAKQPAPRWGWTFFPIWTGQALSWVGSAIAQFALVWWLTDLTGSAAVLATATTVAMLPQIILGPLAGAYVDRWNRRLVMIVADGFIALLSFWLAWLFWQGSLQIWHVYVIMVGRALGGIFHHPAMHASTTMMVPKAQLSRVQGLNQALGGAVNVIGPPLGALALALLALHQVMFIDVVTAIIAIVPLLFVRIPEPEHKPTGVGAKAVVGDMLDGLRYVRGFPGMLAVIGVAIGLNFLGAPIWTLLPLYVRNVFDGGAAGLSMVQSAFGIGLITGGLILSAWGGLRSRVTTAFGAFALMSLAVVGMGGAPSTALWAVAVGWFVFAFFSAIGNGTFAALLQGAVAPEMQGRVSSAVQSGVMLAIPLGLALSTPVVERFGLRSWYLASGAMTTLICLWALTSRAVRRIDEVVIPGEDKGAEPAHEHAAMVGEPVVES
jgi:DHA3 family macrolide efflux protein-like MFS transporter